MDALTGSSLYNRCIIFIKWQKSGGILSKRCEGEEARGRDCLRSVASSHGRLIFSIQKNRISWGQRRSDFLSFPDGSEPTRDAKWISRQTFGIIYQIFRRTSTKRLFKELPVNGSFVIAKDVAVTQNGQDFRFLSMEMENLIVQCLMARENKTLFSSGEN